MENTWLLVINISIIFVIAIGFTLYFSHRQRPKYEELYYWDQRYSQHKENFDWYLDAGELLFIIKRHIRDLDIKIMDLGCGNSMLSPQLYQRNYRWLTAVDFSRKVISKMKQKFPCIKYIECDFTSFQQRFPRSSFDVIIDKAASDTLTYNTTVETQLKCQ